MSEFTTSGKQNTHGAGVKRRSKRASQDALRRFRDAQMPWYGVAAPSRQVDDPLAKYPVLRAVQTGEGLSDRLPAPTAPGGGYSGQYHRDRGFFSGLTSADKSPTSLSLDDVVKMALAKLPQAPTVAAPTVDVSAIKALYEQGKAAVNADAKASRSDLDALQAHAVRQLALSRTAQEGNTRASVAAQTAAAANNALGAAGDYQGGIGMLQGNGVDASLVAELTRAQRGAAKQMTAQGSLGTDLTKANDATMKQIADQQSFDNQSLHTNANREVDKALVAALMGLDSRKTAAVADAEQQNAAALAQAAQANYQSRMQRLADAQSVRQQLLDTAAAQDALATPDRMAALNAAASHGLSGEYFGKVLDMTLQAARDSGEAPTVKGFETNLAKFLRERKSQLGFKSSPWNTDWYMNLARDYFRQDPSQIDAEAAKRYLAGLG